MVIFVHARDEFVSGSLFHGDTVPSIVPVSIEPGDTLSMCVIALVDMPDLAHVDSLELILIVEIFIFTLQVVHVEVSVLGSLAITSGIIQTYVTEVYIDSKIAELVLGR